MGQETLGKNQVKVGLFNKCKDKHGLKINFLLALGCNTEVGRGLQNSIGWSNMELSSIAFELAIQEKLDLLIICFRFLI